MTGQTLLRMELTQYHGSPRHCGTSLAPPDDRGKIMQVIWVYLNDFLHEERGLTIDQASLIVTLFGVGASAGQLLGAKIGQLAYNRHSTLQPLFMGVRNTAQN